LKNIHTKVYLTNHFLTGAEKFQEGLQQLYMQKHAYGNTETMDLWNSWSEVSGQDVAQLKKTWTTVTGYPYLKVSVVLCFCDVSTDRGG